MADSESKKTGQSLQRIKRLVQLMNENGLAELEFEEPDFRLRLAKAVAPSYAPVMQSAQAPAMPVADSQPAAASTPEKPAVPENLIEIKSPIVGTFYRSPAPDSPPFIRVGDQVNPKTVVCIIEAMKVMNELKAECSGTVVKIMAENAQTVEYGQVLFTVKPD